MYPAGNLFIPAPHGNLEAILKEPREDSASGVALVLHPHPLGGGTMHNKVVFRAASALNDAGLITLRINFRSVGQSTGEHDEGRGETEDVRVSLDYLTKQYESEPITLAGFSFGSRVGMEVGISDERVRNLISIGTPVDKYDFAFLKSCRKPILFVHGDRDEFGAADKVRALAATLPVEAHAHVEVIRDADHFFEGHLGEMKSAITEWIRERDEGGLQG
ncbi:MAG: alpha/beta fold hydrolase [Acidobacteria bacterium]|jgi:alpha/beta superfamily hydrolase|nr:alpha/beta fold hydrolase [Acidobacteriota bacterium]